MGTHCGVGADGDDIISEVRKVPRELSLGAGENIMGWFVMLASGGAMLGDSKREGRVYTAPDSEDKAAWRRGLQISLFFTGVRSTRYMYRNNSRVVEKSH